jgi:hypothetical protein
MKRRYIRRQISIGGHRQKKVKHELRMRLRTREAARFRTTQSLTQHNTTRRKCLCQVFAWSSPSCIILQPMTCRGHQFIRVPATKRGQLYLLDSSTVLALAKTDYR